MEQTPPTPTEPDAEELGRGPARTLRKIVRAIGTALRLSVGLATMVLVGVFLFAVFTYDSDAEMVKDYCAYGAVSQAQLDRCIAEVEPWEVDSYADGLTREPTNAGRYAWDELDRCIRDPSDDQVDAGPFCKNR